MNKIFFTALIALFATIATPALAEVKAYLNQSRFYESDPVTLSIETNIKNNAKPDLTPLQKRFTVLGTRASSRISVINGQRSFMKSWTIELRPNKKGILTIPSIALGNDKTEVISFIVTELPPEVTAETKQHVFIESSIGSAENSTFVQQQIPYTVKLFYDKTMQTAQFQSPKVKHSIINKLGADKRYKVTRAGKRFTVVEKHFVISPEKSGALHIPAASVTGRIALSGGDSPQLRKRMDETEMLNKFFGGFNNDPFFNDSFGGGFLSSRSRGPSKPFTVRSKAIDVNVLPVPDAFTGIAWLPAESLSITDSWATQPPELKVGEPVSRTLTLKAKGLSGSQIPNIPLTKSEQIKSYPEKPQFETRTDGNTVYGIQQVEISYIPDAKGKVIIPKVVVDWWDIKNKKQKTFTLPEWRLNVAPDLTAPLEKDQTVDNLAAPKPLAGETSSNESLKDKFDLTNTKTISLTKWGWLGAVTVLLLSLISVVFWRKKRPDIQNKQRRKSFENPAILRRKLLHATQNSDKQLSATLLIQYVQALWGDDDPIQTLGALASQLNTGAKLIKELEQSLYGTSSQPWDGEALTQLIKNGLVQKIDITSQHKSVLSPLYPSH